MPSVEVISVPLMLGKYYNAGGTAPAASVVFNVLISCGVMVWISPLRDFS